MSLYQSRIQIILASPEGIILKTDKNIFNWAEGSSLYQAHPFFEILKAVQDVNNTHNFPCVHLAEQENELICDVTLVIKSTEIEITIFDYTDKYKELNKTTQLRNEAFLKARELELKNKLLLEKEKFKNEFITNINHELRTPLTSILGFIEVLEKTVLDYDQKELIRIIKRQGSVLHAIIDDLLDISKIERGMLKIVEERFNMKSLLDGFKETYKKLAKEKGLKFEYHKEPTIQEFLIGDQVRVYQIINNILSNAFKFTEEGTISLKVSKNYQRSNKLILNFQIKDTGYGISVKNQETMYERFSRFHRDQPIPGTGLGLSIVKELIEKLEGQIQVKSELGQGTTIDVSLPFKYILEKESSLRKKKTYHLPETSKKYRVLLVEDEESTQFLVMKILIDQKSFFVDVAINGEQALNYLEKRNYDIVLMDLGLTKLDGYKTTQRIRNDYGDRIIAEVPIIGFTAKATEKERDKCFRAGMDDFIGKPFKQEDLLRKIKRQIAKKAAS